MKKYYLFLIITFYAQSSFAQPDIVELLALNDSLVQVSVDLPNGITGNGSGVVVSKEYVATNCHVLANAKGASITKYRDGYKPIAMKADWKHDLCLLKFDGLPFKPVIMRDSKTLQYEEEIFSLGYPVGNNVPQPSFGNIKGSYPLDGSVIIRTNAAFAMGSSGGALFDQQFNLIGITSFKSPGSQGYFYSLPVEWIKRLFDAPDILSLNTNDTPFWALPLEKRPYFMQIVIPYQNHQWSSLKKIAQAWTIQEPKSADAWYFLGLAEEGGNEIALAKENLGKAQKLNERHLDAMIALSKIAYLQSDLSSLEKLKEKVAQINQEQGEIIAQKISDLKNH
ncbi:serine protease [Methylotenera sp.]|uniref:serine protease n=1 Tax=Methylotenera sp. TaxID=2051956 RepID=UPI0027315CBD|nr:serine protease [Methylotenera sp.]MDP2231459.1 trypsin-like peptidase domain-containing protein [Methylotenera sp.]MDP3141231.1 trypsin-like peptidase domain-containing protein [Methylotenera sp.]